jgi:hypothetical protein
VAENGWLAVQPLPSAIRAQQITFDAAQGAQLQTYRGMRLSIPPHAFEYEDGSLVTERVTFEVREAWNVSDFAVAGLATTADADFLLSGGMYHLDASVPSRRPVRIRQQAPPIARFPVPTASPDSFLLFRGNPTAANGLNWAPLPGTNAQYDTFAVVRLTENFNDLIVYYHLPTETRNALQAVTERAGKLAALRGFAKTSLPGAPVMVRELTLRWQHALRHLLPLRHQPGQPTLRGVRREHIQQMATLTGQPLQYVWVQGKLYVHKDDVHLLGMSPTNRWLMDRGYLYEPSLNAPDWFRAEFTNITKMVNEVAPAVDALVALDYNALGQLANQPEQLIAKMAAWARRGHLQTLANQRELTAVAEDMHTLRDMQLSHWRNLRYVPNWGRNSTSEERIRAQNTRKRTGRPFHYYYSLVQPACRLATGGEMLATEAFLAQLQHDSILAALGISPVGFASRNPAGQVVILTATEPMDLASLDRTAIVGDIRDYARQVVTTKTHIEAALANTNDRGIAPGGTPKPRVQRLMVVNAPVLFLGWYNIDRYYHSPKDTCEGQLLTAEGAPVQNKMVLVFNARERLMLYTVTNEHGRFSIQVPRGMPMRVACHLPPDSASGSPAQAICTVYGQPNQPGTSLVGGANQAHSALSLSPCVYPIFTDWVRSWNTHEM